MLHCKNSKNYFLTILPLFGPTLQANPVAVEHFSCILRYFGTCGLILGLEKIFARQNSDGFHNYFSMTQLLLFTEAFQYTGLTQSIWTDRSEQTVECMKKD